MAKKSTTRAPPRAPTLEVPPDLQQLSRESRYAVPGGVVSANALQAGQAAQPSANSTAAVAALGDVRIERDGNQRWLVVKRPADKLWDPVREFWTENGFTLALDQPNVGIMETDWAENRAKLPQDIIRCDAWQSVRVAVLHRRARQVPHPPGAGCRRQHRDLHQPPRHGRGLYQRSQGQHHLAAAPGEPELETEFLRRLMVKLGVSEEQSKAIAAAPVQLPPSARIATVGGAPVLQLDEGFDRAWRRVGLALDRTGFTVEDRDRSQGVYFVRYVAPGTDKEKEGFLSKLFGAKGATPPLKYRVVVRSEGNASTVSVLNAAGAPETSANAQSIVRVLADDLK